MFKNSVFQTSVNTKEWFKKAGVRCIKTMAQVAVSMVVVGTFNETSWSMVIQTVVTAGVASILTSVAGIPEVESEE
jgi:hypothetical protein